MTKTPAVRTLLAGFVLLIGTVTQTFAQTPNPIQMLDPKLAPKHEDAAVVTPTADDLKGASVELVKGSVAGSSGWLLKDAKGQPVRRFFDSNGDGKVDVWSYYKDGIETYREFDSTYKGAPNNFRWLNAGGMKWGVGGIDPKTGKAYINGWRMISAEEVGYEAFHAVATRDFARLQILFITDAEMQAVKLSPTSMKKIASAHQVAQKSFETITKKLDLAKAKFQRVDGHPASCTIEDSAAGETIVIKYLNRPVHYEINNKDHAWLHTGEIIQVGMVWRLVGVPSDKDPIHVEPPDRVVVPLEVQKLLDVLSELDKNQPNPAATLAKDAKVTAYYGARIPLVQKIMPLDEAKNRETWYKQLFDNLAALAQNNGDAAVINVLKQLKTDVVKQNPTSNLAAYGTYRVLWTDYAIEMVNAKPVDVAKIQEKWLEDLAGFVKTYDKSEDTPEALIQLARGCEFGGKDEQAKRWYTRLADDFPKDNLAPGARGSVARLNLPGNELKLTAPLLADNSKLFDMAQLKNKIVIVHYWASFTSNYSDDFVRLKRILDDVGKKHGIELVSINLDDTADQAKNALKTVTTPATHLYQTPQNNMGGGLNSPLATQYGIHMLPTMFMVGRDGKVINRSLQVGDIDTELKKLLVN